MDIVLANSLFYITDHGNRTIVVFNLNYQYVKSFPIPSSPNFIKIIDNSVAYISTHLNSYKTDLNFSILNTYQNPVSDFSDIYYNQTCECLYVGCSNVPYIFIFNRNLVLLSTVASYCLQPFNIWSFVAIGNTLYASTNNPNIYYTS